MKRTISKKVTISVVSIVVVMFTIMSIVIGCVVSNKLLDRYKSELQIQADKYNEEINAWVQQKMLLVEETATDLMCDNDFLRPNVYKVLAKHIEGQEDVFNLYLCTETQDIIMNDQELEKVVLGVFDPRTRPWYITAKEKGATIIENPYKDETTQSMCTTISTPIYDSTGALYGVLAADVYLTKLQEIIDGIVYDEGAYGFLIDSAGNYVTHPNEKFNPTPEASILAMDVMPNLKSIFTKPGSRIIESKNYNGQNMYFATALAEASGWSLGVAIPKNNATSEVVSVMTILVVIIILSIIIIATVLFLMMILCNIAIQSLLRRVTRMYI